LKENNTKEEIVRLNQILETIKKDALEVSDLLVKGIEFYELLGLCCIVLAFIFGAQFLQNLSGSLFVKIEYDVFAAMFVLFGAYSLRKNYQLKKKYAELIDIHKALAEE
jgi:ATP/ADP translocase